MLTRSVLTYIPIKCDYATGRIKTLTDEDFGEPDEEDVEELLLGMFIPDVSSQQTVTDVYTTLIKESKRIFDWYRQGWPQYMRIHIPDFYGEHVEGDIYRHQMEIISDNTQNTCI